MDACSVLIHRAAKNDALNIVEGLFKCLPDTEKDGMPGRCDAVNTPRGHKGYTPLCHALYRGNIKMAKALIAAGADVEFVNIDGEDLHSMLDAGENDYAHREELRADALFIREKYRQCRVFLDTRRAWVQRTTNRDTRVHTYWPRTAVRAATKIQRWYKRTR